MIKLIFILMFFTLGINYCFAQIINDTVYEHWHLPQYEKSGEEIILKDAKTGTRFILDTTRTHVIAINSKGVQMWNITPYEDTTSLSYLFTHPTIVTFCFAKNDFSKNKIVIWVEYSNTNTGYINKENGHYSFIGQD
jgi:hypothetical protein